jgi:holin-like protein
MKYLKQFLIIMLVSCIGEVLHTLIPLPVPANIYGLVLMLLLLVSKILPLDAVKETAEFLIQIMPVMFIPAAVGLIVYWEQLKPIIIPVLAITIISTVLVILSTGKTSDLVLRGKEDE